MAVRSLRKETITANKVVVRCLPSSLLRETFLEQVSPLPDYDYLHFAPADPTLGNYAYSTVYINFLHLEDVIIFKEKFDGYVFLDNKGNEYPAIVEFAPFQKVPKKKAKRVDEKKGTIENDNDYKKFLENFQSEGTKVANVDISAVLEEIENREKELKASIVQKGSTPLLEFLKKKREERRLAVQKTKDDKRKKELERKQREEELRARRRNENMKLKAQDKRIIKDRTDVSSAKTMKTSDAERKNFDSYKTYDKFSYLDESEKPYYRKDMENYPETKRKEVPEKLKHDLDLKPSVHKPKSDSDRNKEKSTDTTAPVSKKSDSSYSHDKADRNSVPDYGESYDLQESADYGNHKHKDSSSYEGSREHSYKRDDRRRYGSAQSDRKSSYDSHYYKKEWSSSGRSDYYGGAKMSKQQHSDNYRSNEKEKKVTKHNVVADEKKSSHVTREASMNSAGNEKIKNDNESKQETYEDKKDFVKDKDSTPETDERVVHRKKSADESQAEPGKQSQKTRYRDRPERAIYNPKQRLAERRKQTQPSTSNDRGDSGANENVSERSGSDVVENVQE